MLYEDRKGMTLTMYLNMPYQKKETNSLKKKLESSMMKM